MYNPAEKCILLTYVSLIYSFENKNYPILVLKLSQFKKLKYFHCFSLPDLRQEMIKYTNFMLCLKISDHLTLMFLKDDVLLVLMPSGLQETDLLCLTKHKQ